MPVEVVTELGTATQDTPQDVTRMSREDLSKLANSDMTQDEVNPIEQPVIDEGVTALKKEEAVKTDEVIDPAKQADTVSKSDYETLQNEHNSLKERWSNQEKLLNRFGNEIGIMRKMSPEQVQQEMDRIRALWREDPIAADEALTNLRTTQANDARREEMGQMLKQVNDTREVIKHHIPDFEASLEEMSALIAEDGAGPEFVQAFKENPYFLDHTTLLNMHKRAALAKENIGLKTQIEALTKEVEELKKKPGELVKKIQDATKFKPETAATKGAAGSQALYDKLPSQMTTEELAAAKEKMRSEA